MSFTIQRVVAVNAIVSVVASRARQTRELLVSQVLFLVVVLCP